MDLARYGHSMADSESTHRAAPQYEKWPEEEALKPADATRGGTFEMKKEELGLPLNKSIQGAIDYEAEAVRSRGYDHSFIEVPPQSPHPEALMRFPTDRQNQEVSLDEDGVPRKPTRMEPDPKLVQ